MSTVGATWTRIRRLAVKISAVPVPAGHGEHVVDEEVAEAQVLTAEVGLDDGPLVLPDDVVVADAALVGEEALPRGQRDGEVPALGVGQLDTVAGADAPGVGHGGSSSFVVGGAGQVGTVQV